MAGGRMGEFFQGESCYILFYLFQAYIHWLKPAIFLVRKLLRVYVSITDVQAISTEHALQEDDLLA